MAWIKMRADLHEDPAVLDLMTLTGLDVFAVIGKLHAIWSWADSASPDGHVHSVTPSSLVLHIERKVECAGFVAAMCQVGWMRIENDRIVFPKFDRHMSKSAKNRALAAERQSRNRRDNTSRTKRDKSVTREDKRREEKTEEPESLRSSGSRNTWLTPFGTAWSARYGGEMPWGRAGSALSPLCEKHGAERVLRAWIAYLSATEGEFASPQRFASTFGRWDGTAPASQKIDPRAPTQNIPPPAAPDPEFRARYDAAMGRRRAPQSPPEPRRATIIDELMAEDA